MEVRLASRKNAFSSYWAGISCFTALEVQRSMCMNRETGPGRYGLIPGIVLLLGCLPSLNKTTIVQATVPTEELSASIRYNVLSNRKRKHSLTGRTTWKHGWGNTHASRLVGWQHYNMYNTRQTDCLLAAPVIMREEPSWQEPALTKAQPSKSHWSRHCSLSAHKKKGDPGKQPDCLSHMSQTLTLT